MRIPRMSSLASTRGNMAWLLYACIAQLFAMQSFVGETRAADPAAASNKQEFPLTWEKLLQLTGPQGPTVRYLQNKKGEVVRAEAYQGRSLSVAVSKWGEGFRITLGDGSPAAAADVLTRPWFTKQESNELIEAYGAYLDTKGKPFSERMEDFDIGRFHVFIAEDPALPIKDSIVFTPRDEVPAAATANVNGLEFKSSLGMSMMPVSAGRFVMGSPASEAGHGDDEEQVEVEISQAFWIARTEVTQEEWSAVMGTTPWKGLISANPKFPAVGMTWMDAKAFCMKATQVDRKAGVLPEGVTYSLPSEAQWEYACRAGTTTRFSSGDEEASLASHAWTGFNKDKDRSPTNLDPYEVGRLKPNAWGLCDMHGNVCEWCEDWYGAKRQGGKDAQGPAEGNERVLRGGNWISTGMVRCAARDTSRPEQGNGLFGFRVVATRGSDR